MATLSQSRSGITQLEFHQAMNDFKTMFPEMDEDVIEVVLRANNGAVDATIDQLLAMNMDSEREREKLRTESIDSNQHNEVDFKIYDDIDFKRLIIICQGSAKICRNSTSNLSTSCSIHTKRINEISQPETK